jgi:hypothetical protein
MAKKIKITEEKPLKHVIVASQLLHGAIKINYFVQGTDAPLCDSLAPKIKIHSLSKTLLHVSVYMCDIHIYILYDIVCFAELIMGF